MEGSGGKGASFVDERERQTLKRCLASFLLETREQPIAQAREDGCVWGEESERVAGIESSEGWEERKRKAEASKERDGEP